jgi:methylenetetrahydrofolate reductase (NADPH)
MYTNIVLFDNNYTSRRAAYRSLSQILSYPLINTYCISLFQDEAFALWKQQWARVYPEGSKSREVIDTIHDSYLLVNLVDNDYVAGNCLFEAIKKAVELVDTKEETAPSVVTEANGANSD